MMTEFHFWVNYPFNLFLFELNHFYLSTHGSWFITKQKGLQLRSCHMTHVSIAQSIELCGEKHQAAVTEQVKRGNTRSSNSCNFANLPDKCERVLKEKFTSRMKIS